MGVGACVQENQLMRVDFHISCIVQPKQSVRSRVAYSKTGKPYVATYQTQKIKKNAEALASLIAPYRPQRSLVGPLCALYVVRYPFRKSEPKKNRKGPIPKTTTPDHEQLAKQLGDVLQSCGFFANDAHIYHATVVKLWDARQDVHIYIEESDVVWAGIPRLELAQ